MMPDMQITNMGFYFHFCSSIVLVSIPIGCCLSQTDNGELSKTVLKFSFTSELGHLSQCPRHTGERKFT